MRSTRLKRLKYRDFPVRLFFYLLSKPDRMAHLLIGSAKWDQLKQQWEKNNPTIVGDNAKEKQTNVVVPFLKAQKALLILQWMRFTTMDVKEVLEKHQLPYDPDPLKCVQNLEKYIRKNSKLYENNLIQLENYQLELPDQEENDFSIDEAIASFDLAGFTINDPNKLTIGEYESMNKALKRGKKEK